MNKSNLIFIVFIFLFIQISISFAQEVIELERIVVTASRLESYVKDVPTQATVIDSKEIVESGVQNVDDLLRDVCGIDVSRRTGFTSSTSTVTLRGFGGQARGRTLVLIDGIPFNEIYSGEVYWNAIPKEDIERIEVVPGATSGLYGPGAMGGVINIITKKPKKQEFEFDAEYGSFATRSFNLSHQNKLGKFSYLASGGWFKTDGYVAAVDRKDYDIRRDKENYNINFKLLYDFNDKDSVGVGYRHYEEDVNGGRKYYYGSKDLDNLNFNFKKWIGAFEFLSALYFDWEDSSWTYDKSPAYTTIDYINNNPKRGMGGNLQTNIYFNDFNTFSMGTDWRWGKIDSEDEYKTTVRRVETKGEQRTIGIYLQDEINLYEKLIISLGGRLDYWKNYDGYLYDDNLSPKATNYSAKSDTTFSPKTGLSYHLTKDTTIRAAFGKSFRTPTLYDLYRTWKYGTTTYRSNPNLNSEKAYSYEVGFDQALWGKILGRFTFYYSDVSDLIYSVDVGSKIKEKQNVGKVKIYGYEAELKYELMDGIMLFSNYTFNKSKIRTYTNDSLKGKYLTYTPKNKSSFGLSFHNPKFIDIVLKGRYTGIMFHDDANTQKLKEHLIWDMVFSKKIMDNFEVSLEIENLQDRKYQEYKGYLAPLRTISVSGKLTF